MTIVERAVADLSIREIVRLVGMVDGETARLAIQGLWDDAVDFVTHAGPEWRLSPKEEAVAAGVRWVTVDVWPLRRMLGPDRATQHVILSNIATRRKVEDAIRTGLGIAYDRLRSPSSEDTRTWWDTLNDYLDEQSDD